MSVPMQGSVYRSASDIHTLTEGDELAAEALLPGFRCPVTSIFAEP